MTRSTVMTAALVAMLAGTGFAADVDSQTQQGGQYQSSIVPVRVKGTGGDFAASAVHVPFILDFDNTVGAGSVNSLLNGPAAEWINGKAYGTVTTFGSSGSATPGTAAPRVVVMLGTVDGDTRLSTNTSNNSIVDEGSRNLSNSTCSLLPDGTIVFFERFGGGTGFAHHNQGAFNNAHLLGVAPVIGGPNKIISSTAANIGNAAETLINPNPADVVGGVFEGVCSSVRDTNRTSANDENLLTAITVFNTLPTLTAVQRAATTNGVIVFDGLNNDPTSNLGPTSTATCGTLPNQVPPPGFANPYVPGPGTLAYWLQASVPVPSNPAGECFADARQSKPAMALVRTPGGASLPYAVHGIGFQGGTPFTGGSARVLLLAVDTVYQPGSTVLGRQDYTGSNATKSFNTILIEADAAGGVGSVHGAPFDRTLPLAPGFADHFNSDPNKKFFEQQATGTNPSPGGQSTLTMFDINSKGQVAALHVDEGVSPNRFEVRVYNPTWDAVNDRIEGYTLGAIVTFNGDVDNGGNPLIVPSLTTTREISAGNFQNVTLVPFSGIAIDDDGRVSFVGITEKFEELGDFDLDNTTPFTTYLNNTTATLFVWEPTTNTLHSVLKGGQNGDVLADAFPASGAPTNDSLALGFFPIAEDSDLFGRESMSRTNGVIAVNFRAGGNEQIGNTNFEFETLPAGNADDFNDNGGVLTRGSGAGLVERAVRGTVLLTLGNFQLAFTCCPGDANGNNVVNFADITSVLNNFNTVYGYAPNTGQSAGDSNCNAVVNFADITSTLNNFNTACN